MSEWRDVKFGELIDVINGYAFKSINFLDSQEENSLPVLKIKNVANGDANIQGVQYHSYSENLSRYLIEKGDILIALTGNHPQAETQVVGIASRYNLASKALLNQRVAKIISKDENKICNEYIYYFLRDKNTHLYIASQSSGSANQANISKSDIEDIPFSLPSPEEQKAIAQILSSLDDKIDLLHRQNKTLEAIAETLFRQWFIEEALADWEEKPLSTIADFLNGLACQKLPPKNDMEKLPVLKIRELKSGIGDDCDYATTDVNPEYVVNAGDVIFAWSASLIVKMWDGQTCVLNQHLFKVTSKEFPKWFYYHWCKFHLDEFIAISQAHATTMGHIKRGDLDRAIAIVPPKDVLNNMDNRIAPIFNKLQINNKQIHTLEKLRDTLLPKLMSGEVRVQFTP